MTGGRRTHVSHALRVAVVATGIVAVAYGIAVGAFDMTVNHHLTEQADSRLSSSLAATAKDLVSTPSPSALPAANADPDDAPLFTWWIGRSGNLLGASAGAPALRPHSWARTGAPTTATLGSSVSRLEARAFEGGWLVAGLSMADQRHVVGLLLAGELVAGPVVLLGMFFGSLIIGVKASAPVEQARRRQLEFTADASHELRTPLSVIAAELDLALGRPRPAEDYRGALERIRGESGRLRLIVDNLLWLGRLDAATPPPSGEPIDLATIAQVCVERFSTLAGARGLALRLERRGTGAPWLRAPADWIDRLAAVLVDNACRYTPAHGTVRVVVETRGGRLDLAVEDSGPGIPPAEWPRLLDRFHRASDEPGGTGLGLAIADAIVRNTGGQWQVGTSDLGGARIAVSWHGPHGRQPAPGPPESTTTSRKESASPRSGGVTRAGSAG